MQFIFSKWSFSGLVRMFWALKKFVFVVHWTLLNLIPCDDCNTSTFQNSAVFPPKSMWIICGLADGSQNWESIPVAVQLLIYRVLLCYSQAWNWTTTLLQIFIITLTEAGNMTEHNSVIQAHKTALLNWPLWEFFFI